MAKIDARLDKLEGELSPKQFVMKYIDTMQQYDSLDECSLSFMSGGWKTLKKGDAERIYDAIRDRMKKEKKEPGDIHRACKKASNEMQFLYILFTRMCSSFIQDYYRHKYNRLFLDTTLMRAQAVKELEGAEKDEALQAMMAVWSHRATRHLFHLYHEKALADAIAGRFYDGRSLLFKAEREKLDAMLKSAEEHVEKVNRISMADEDGELGMLQYAVDVEKVQQEVRDNLETAVQYEIDMAKAAVYSEAGEPEKTFGIMEPYAAKELATASL